MNVDGKIAGSTIGGSAAVSNSSKSGRDKQKKKQDHNMVSPKLSSDIGLNCFISQW